MNKDKKIFIHIGPGKTGSSAIQSWLSSNANFLDDNKIYYPPHKVNSNGVSSGNLHSIMVIEGGHRYICPEKVKALKESFYNGDYHTLLLSSEFFWVEIEQINDFFPDSEIIAYIRNPLDLFESNYNQGVKRHKQVNKFKPPSNLENHLWGHLSKIVKIIGNSRLHLRPYSKDFFYKGSIVSDLMKAVGVDVDVDVENINPSFTLPALELKRALNNFDFFGLDSKIDTLLQAYKKGDVNYSFLSDEEYEVLLEQVSNGFYKFIEENKRYELLSFQETFKNLREKKYKEQKVDVKEMAFVVDYIFQESPSLYENIKNVLVENNNIFLDDYSIFELFSVPFDAFDPTLSSDFVEVVKRFKIMPKKYGNVFFELGEYYFSIGDNENAFGFLKAACFFNPKNANFKRSLNKVIMHSNKKTVKREVLASCFSLKAKWVRNLYNNLFKSRR